MTAFAPKPRRGPKPKVSASAVRGRADNYRVIFHNIWDQLAPVLSGPQTKESVINAFEIATPGGNEFQPYASMIADLLNDPQFPKRKSARINFLADSVAALGRVSARRSRDICASERAKAKRTHFILRYEFFIVCSCGYDGHSENHACPKCGARIRPSVLDEYL